jgi:hypothetical protein
MSLVASILALELISFTNFQKHTMTTNHMMLELWLTMLLLIMISSPMVTGFSIPAPAASLYSTQLPATSNLQHQQHYNSDYSRIIPRNIVGDDDPLDHPHPPPKKRQHPQRRRISQRTPAARPFAWKPDIIRTVSHFLSWTLFTVPGTMILAFLQGIAVVATGTWIRTFCKVVLPVLPPWVCLFVQPILILYFVPLFALRQLPFS